MSERSLILVALGVVFGAAVSWEVPGIVVVGVCALALLVRHPACALVALTVLATSLASRAEEGVATVRHSEAIDGIADLVSDPARAEFGWTVELRVHDGRRLWAQMPHEVGAALATLRMGERVRLEGVVSPLDATPSWMKSRHLAGRVTVRRLDAYDRGPLLWRSVNAVQRLTGAGMQPLDEQQRALYLGIVFGDDRGQSAVQQYRFRASGIAHLLAVSGQNLALMVVVAAPLLGRLARTPRVAVSAVLIVWFCVLTRIEPSVLRAAAMVLIAAVAWWHGRFVSARRILWVAVIALVLIDPLLIWSLGFRLSVAASIGLIEFARPLAERLRGPRWFRQPLAVALAAQSLTSLLLVNTFGPTSLLSPIVNLLAVPIGGALMVWGAATGPLAGILGAPVDEFASWPARALLWGLDALATVGAHPGIPRVGLGGAVATAFGCALPWASLHWPGAIGTRGIRRLMVVAVVVVVGDLTLSVRPFSSVGEPRLVAEVAGVERWQIGRSEVWVLDGGATPRRVLDALGSMRRPVVALVVVVGGGKRSAGAVWALRQVAEPGAIVAMRPELVADAGSLPAGILVVDGVAFRLGGDGRPAPAHDAVH
ncbi:MAG: ComEC/Rec2 family competence protein [Actinobacteria bacterium]|nr:ComEC/Rec2 family competence protein [Actinomycetota bacterium]